MPRLRIWPSIVAVSLALVTCGIAAQDLAPYRLVSSRGENPGELRVWEVTEDGVMTQKHLEQTGNIGSGNILQIDPFGRFMVYPSSVPTETGNERVIDLYAFDDTWEPILADQASREGWRFSGSELSISPDGRFLFITSRDEANAQSFIEAVEITPEMQLVFHPDRFEPMAPYIEDILVSSSQQASGEYTVYYSGRLGGSGVFIVGIPFTPTEGFAGQPHILLYNAAAIFNGGIPVRQDQRLMVAGGSSSLFCFQLRSIQIDLNGHLSDVDCWSLAELGPLTALPILFHPTGNSLVAGWVLRSVPISRSGEFFAPAIAIDSDDGTRDAPPAISPDGRLAITTYKVQGGLGVWGAFSLDPFGGVEHLHDNLFPFGYTGLAFIPPRTEEMLGDANGDGLRDVGDIVTYLNHFNDDGTHPVWHPLSPIIRGPVPEARADADQDGEITPADLAWTVDFLLGWNSEALANP